MEKKAISSFGSIVVPIHMRKELGIDGNVMVNIGVRELQNGEKEIVIRKPLDTDDILEKYGVWAEVIARVAESSVALIWNNHLLSMSSSTLTESFVGKRIQINPLFKKYIIKCPKGAIVNNPEELSLLSSGPGVVYAFYPIKSVDDWGYFVIVRGSKNDKTLSKIEEKKRYKIISDIVSKI